MLQLVTRI